MVPGQFKDGLVHLLCLRWRRHEVSERVSLGSEQREKNSKSGVKKDPERREPDRKSGEQPSLLFAKG